MKSEIIKIDKERALDLLSRNDKNRRLKKNTLASYVEQMKSGNWKENGEPIIIDKNGVIKDGQHRLHAIVKTDFSYIVPIIYDIEPDVMDTIDTGSNRTASDVLFLNGFKYNAHISKIAKHIIKYKSGISMGNNDAKKVITNASVLNFAQENEELLYTIIRSVLPIRNKSNKDFLDTDLCFYLYVVSNGKPEEKHLNFIKNLSGVIVSEGDACSYVRRLISKSKKSKITLHKNYVLALVIKAYNSFIIGNPAVRYLKHDLKHDMPKPIY